MFLIVGESLGRLEQIKGEPLVGDTGQTVMQALKTLGLKRDQVWLDNVIACKPSPNHTDKQKREAAKCCRGRLNKVFEKFPGKPILGLGAICAAELTGDPKLPITEYSGTWRSLDLVGQRDLVITLHPAAFLRAGPEASVNFWGLLYDMAKVAELASGEAKRFDDKDVFIVRDTHLANVTLQSLIFSKPSIIGGDLETTGQIAPRPDDETDVEHEAIEPAWADITAIGIATEDCGFAIEWGCLDQQGKSFIAQLLGDESIIKCGHNFALYDRCVLAWNGFEVRGKIDDTMLMHHGAFPGFAHRLQRVASQFLIVPPWKSEHNRDGDESMDDLLDYCSKDTLCTLRVRTPLMEATSKPALYDFDSRMADLAFKMHMRGVPISLEVNKRLGAEIEPKIIEKEKELRSFWDDEPARIDFIEKLCREQAKKPRKKDSSDYEERVSKRKQELEKKINKGKFIFNPASSVQVASFLDTLGVHLTDRTEKGAISTRKEILESYTMYKPVKDLLSFRDYSKSFNTYIRDIPAKVKKDEKRNTHRIHPAYSVIKNNGRWSTRPATQNFPHDMRCQVEAPPGYVLIDADYEQIDARCIALESGDPYLLNIFSAGIDLHDTVATDIVPGYKDLPHTQYGGKAKCQKQINGVWCQKCLTREVIKNVEYAGFYGAGAEKLFITLFKEGFTSITRSDTSKMLSLIEERMPYVVQWRNELVRKAYRTRKVEAGDLGRERCFPIGDLDVNVIYSHAISARTAEIMGRGLDVLENRLLPEWDAFPVLQVHDSAVTECKEEYADIAKEVVRESLTQTLTKDGISVTFTVGVKISKSWS